MAERGRSLVRTRQFRNTRISATGCLGFLLRMVGRFPPKPDVIRWDCPMATEVTEGVREVTSVLTLTICVKKGGIVDTRLPGFTETRGRPPIPGSAAECI